MDDNAEDKCIHFTSRGRSGGLVFPSLSEFSTVYCDPHNQRLWHLGGKDPLEKEMATHSGLLAWRIPWAEEPGGL